MILKDLLIRLGLDLDSASFAEGQLAADALKGALGLIVDAAKAVGKAMVEMTVGTIKAADQIDEVAQSTGLSTDELQELAYAGSFSSLSMEQMAQAVGFLSKNMSEAALGNKELRKAFKSTGVATKNADGTLRSANDVLADLADHFKSMPNSAEKTALSMEIFGKAGKQLIPLLNAGSDEINKFREEAHRLGVVLDEDVIKKAAATDDNFNRLEQTWKGVKFAVGQQLLPLFAGLAEKTFAWVQANREAIASGISAFFEGLFAAAKATYDAIVFIVDGVKQFVEEFKKGEGPIYDVVSALLPLVALLSFLHRNWDRIKAAALEVWAVLDKLLTPILELLAPLIELVQKHWDKIVTAFKYGTLVVLAPLIAAVASLVAMFVTLGGIVLVAAAALAEFFLHIKEVGRAIGAFFVMVGTSIKETFGAAVDWVSAKIDWLLDKLNVAIDYANKLPGINIANRNLGGAIGAVTSSPALVQAAPAVGARAGNRTVTQTFSPQLNIVRQAGGESDADFAQRVRQEFETHTMRVLREAAVGAAQ